MTFEPVFEIGSMPGLIALFSRHSGIMTNFKILVLESRLYWSWEGIAECEELGCAEGPARAWSDPADADNACKLMVGPWQYQCSG